MEWPHASKPESSRRFGRIVASDPRVSTRHYKSLMGLPSIIHEQMRMYVGILLLTPEAKRAPFPSFISRNHPSFCKFSDSLQRPSFWSLELQGSGAGDDDNRPLSQVGKGTIDSKTGAGPSLTFDRWLLRHSGEDQRQLEFFGIDKVISTWWKSYFAKVPLQASLKVPVPCVRPAPCRGSARVSPV